MHEILNFLCQHPSTTSVFSVIEILKLDDMHVISSVFVVVNWLLFSFRVFYALDTGGMSFLFPVIGQLS